MKLKSRIDFFLISGKFLHDVIKVETRASIAPDHKAVSLSINLNDEFKRGSGLWKFNNTLLQDECFLQLIKDYYPCILQKQADVTDKQLLWELIKMEIRSETIRYSKKTRCFRDAYTGLPVVRVTENQKALNCVVLNYSFPVSEE